MDGILKSILVHGEGSVTSEEVCDTARSIVPKNLLSHQEVQAHVATNHPDVKIVQTSGGGGSKYPHFKFHDLLLVSASELAKKAELLLSGIIWEEFEVLTGHIKRARDLTVDHPVIERAISGFAGERRVLAIKEKDGVRLWSGGCSFRIGRRLQECRQDQFCWQPVRNGNDLHSCSRT